MERAVSHPDFAPAERAATDERSTVKPAGNVLADLTKARLSAMVLVTTAIGYALAAFGETIAPWHLVATLVGTALAAFSASVFNQVIEANRDRTMDRTRNRPIPSGRVSRAQAIALGTVLGIAGPALLWFAVNPLASLLAIASLVIYVAIYTPLKPRTTLNTIVGAVCGALPPMIGWAAITGGLEAGAWILFLLLFFWQIPHFMALAWLYRDDYARGGFRMLPVVDPSGERTGTIAVLYAAALLPLGPLAAIQGVSGWAFAAEATALAVAFTVLSWQMRQAPTRRNARVLFFASLIYLPAVLGLMLADRGNAPTPSGYLRGATPTNALPALEVSAPARR